MGVPWKRITDAAAGELGSYNLRMSATGILQRKKEDGAYNSILEVNMLPFLQRLNDILSNVGQRQGTISDLDLTSLGIFPYVSPIGTEPTDIWTGDNHIWMKKSIQFVDLHSLAQGGFMMSSLIEHTKPSRKKLYQDSFVSLLLRAVKWKQNIDKRVNMPQAKRDELVNKNKELAHLYLASKTITLSTTV